MTHSTNDVLQKQLAAYDYDVPKELVALEPAEPRDQARLMVYDRSSQKIKHALFRDLLEYLPKKVLIVFNKTKVIPARLTVHKTSGGKIVLLFTNFLGEHLEALCERSLKAGEQLIVGGGGVLKVLGKVGPNYQLKYVASDSKTFADILEKQGVMPIPPYLKKTTLAPEQLKEKYQSVFAQQPGSIAAPTASLHFTKALMQELQNAGHELIFLTLNVSLGTFASLTEQNINTQRLHTEHYHIESEAADKIIKAKAAKKPIVAVGTTVVRTLESWWRSKQPVGSTDLFIQPGYKFQVVNHLITNFHVPRSSLMMLVAALTSTQKLQELYQIAIQEKYRFFSFGDGMLII